MYTLSYSMTSYLIAFPLPTSLTLRLDEYEVMRPLAYFHEVKNTFGL